MMMASNRRWLRLQVRLRRYYPRSILRVMMLGFAVVMVPLIIALVTATIYVGHLTSVNRQAVMQATNAVRYSRLLVAELGEMKRDARIYEILGDESFLQAYHLRSSDFRQTAKKLRSLRGGSQQATHLSRLLAKEQILSQKLARLTPGSNKASQTVAQFEAMRRLGQQILTRNRRLIAKKVQHLRQMSQHLRQVVLWQASVSLPLATILCALVIMWIIRPLRAVEKSIRQLGSADFSQPIKVHGPRDIEELGTRLEWLRLRLHELENQKQSFLEHMSHELKTPLTSVREGASLLADAVAGPLNSEQQEITEILEKNTLQLQQRIESLLEFSMARDQYPLLHLTTVGLESVVTEAVNDHCLSARAGNIEVSLQLEPLTARVDREQIRCVLGNLLSNAVKYAPRGSTISVKLCRDGDYAQVNIQDQGPGISLADREHVFEAFYQGEPPPAGAGHVKGSGIGLSLARRYVESHGGSLEVVDSETGACFEMRVPRHDA